MISDTHFPSYLVFGYGEMKTRLVFHISGITGSDFMDLITGCNLGIEHAAIMETMPKQLVLMVDKKEWIQKAEEKNYPIRKDMTDQELAHNFELALQNSDSVDGEVIVRSAEWKQAIKKPITVQYREPIPWCNCQRVTGSHENIRTLEGAMIAVVGKHVVVRGVEGEEYPVEKGIFKKTYISGETDEILAQLPNLDIISVDGCPAHTAFLIPNLQREPGESVNDWLLRRIKGAVKIINIGVGNADSKA